MQNINAKKYQSEASKSASDYWENALMVSRRDDEAVQQVNLQILFFVVKYYFFLFVCSGSNYQK